VSSPTSPDFYDAELCAHHEHLRAAYGIAPGDEVVDIGCGTGLTTRDAARAAAPGRVVGVDLSERMLERARLVTAAKRLDNVRYELGDAQVHRFDPAGFDAAQPPPPGADPFSLGDAEATARILEAAGFEGMRFEDVHEPVLYGHDLDAALAFVRGFQNTSAALASLGDGEAARTVERLRETLAAHYSDERGVVLDSRSWLITARRRR
jgi:SAM-dependent methyltransferase